jgi:hypothetical protein
MTVTVNIAAMLVVASYSLLEMCQRFWRIVACIFRLDVEEERTSETLTNVYQNTRLRITEDVNPHCLTVGHNDIF